MEEAPDSEAMEGEQTMDVAHVEDRLEDMEVIAAPELSLLPVPVLKPTLLLDHINRNYTASP